MKVNSTHVCKQMTFGELARLRGFRVRPKDFARPPAVRTAVAILIARGLSIPLGARHLVSQLANPSSVPKWRRIRGGNDESAARSRHRNRHSRTLRGGQTKKQQRFKMAAATRLAFQHFLGFHATEHKMSFDVSESCANVVEISHLLDFAPSEVPK